jgi:hypothetical protein
MEECKMNATFKEKVGTTEDVQIFSKTYTIHFSGVGNGLLFIKGYGYYSYNANHPEWEGYQKLNKDSFDGYKSKNLSNSVKQAIIETYFL